MPVFSRGGVYAETEAIRTLAGQFAKWSDDVDRVIPGVRNGQFTPGSVDNAADLATRYKDYVTTGFVNALTHLKDSLYQVGVELTAVADEYADAEDDNTDDLERLADALAAARKPFGQAPPANPNQE